MKILFIRSNPVNPDSRVEKEVKALLDNGHEVTILAWDRESNHNIVKSNIMIGKHMIYIYRLGIKSEFSAGFKKNLKPLIKFQFGIISFIRKHRNDFDVIHSCDFDTAFSSYFFKKKNVKFIYDIFDYYVDSFSVPNYLKYAIEKIDSYIINKADYVIICTDQRKKQLKYANPKKLCVIHNTPQYCEFKKNDNFDVSSEKIKIVYVGILSYGRNILEMCDFVSNNSEYELHIGGFGILENKVKNFSDSNDNIKYYGKLSYEMTLELESKCDIITAFYDPKIRNHKFAAPNKFYEALMLGKPVVMALDTGMSDIVEKYEIGAVVPFDKPELGFQILCSKKKDWDTISTKEKDLYKKEYSWEKMEKRLVSIYDELIK